MSRGDKFKHIRKKGTLPPAFLNNTMIHLLTAFANSQVKEPKEKLKHEGPTATWPCAIDGCRNPRHIEPYGKIRRRCHKHQLEYLRELARMHRLAKLKRKKNALPK